jgi:hypothetical protein
MLSLQTFKTQNNCWMAFVVQADFQKYCKANFTATDIDTNMNLTKERGGGNERWLANYGVGRLWILRNGKFDVYR